MYKKPHFKHVVTPKKGLGQHFLKDDGIAQDIAHFLSTDTQNVLEIGPGTGVLTKHLIDKNIQLKLIEIDTESIAYLKKNEKYADKIIEGDFLKIKTSDIFQGPFSIIGNFPYNISSQILFKVLENKEQVTEVVGMFQKEVAQRICASKGNKVYGILSVLVQAFYDTEYLITVPPEVFLPPPKVFSAVIRIKRKSNYTLDCDESLFFKIVKKAFNQRRKTLRNALKEYDFSSSVPSDIWQKRAEALSVDDFINLTQHFIEK